MTTRAVQYLRMSSDQQALSIAMQTTAIAAYAQLHGYEIVGKYLDEARSGLSLSGREGKQQLLQDVMAVDRDFDCILVTDVTRWGRYQDVDESAYYEYHCRKHGVSIVYVLEHFANDGSLISGMEKYMKRVMAAGYSRDLAIKCRAGQVETVNRGYATGRPPCLGYRRQSVSRNGEPGRILGPNERKPGVTDRVRWVLGPPEEVEIVKGIFREFAHGGSLIGIVRRLRASNVLSHDGKPVTVEMVRLLLESPIVTGQVVWGTKSQVTGAKTGIERLAEAARNSTMVEPIVDTDTWELVQQRHRDALHWRHFGYQKHALLDQLRAALVHDPRLAVCRFSERGLPHPSTYRRHFGSVTAALAAAAGPDVDESEPAIPKVVRNLRIGKRVTSDVFDLVRSHDPDAKLFRHKNLISLGSITLKVRVASQRARGQYTEPHWYVGHLDRYDKANRWLLVLCLNPDMNSGREFVLLPPPTHAKFNGRLTTRVLSEFESHRIRDKAALLRALLLAAQIEHVDTQLSLDLDA